MTTLSDETLKSEYEKDNYICLNTGIDSDLCYLFFSSHGLYYPDEPEVFQKVVVEDNRFEWKWVVGNSKIPRKAGRIIYIRDIYKEFYCKGISTENDTIEKTIELLRKLTEGYRTITVGSSAGGYMAALIAAKLDSLYCFDFSGHFKIQSEVRNEYQDLNRYLKNYQGKIYYFYAANNSGDVQQFEYATELTCVKPFPFSSEKHADTMFAGNMSYIIDLSGTEMNHLWEKCHKKKMINKISFLFYTTPLRAVFKIGWHEGISFIQRRLGRLDSGL